MKLAALLGLFVPAIRGATLTYPDNISLFEFSWTNPDQGPVESTGPTDGTLMTDGDTTIGSGEILTNAYSFWGNISAPTTVAMVGTFQATTLDLDAGYTYWAISTAALVFESGSCFTDDTSASAFYYDRSTGAQVALTVTTTSVGDIYTFSADITDDLQTNGYIGFDITSNMACEGNIEILEFVLEGEQTATPSPTNAPTTVAPTVSPTAEPTAAPVTAAPTTGVPTTAAPTTTTAPPTTTTTPAPITTTSTTTSPPETTSSTTSPPETTTEETTTTTEVVTTEECPDVDFKLSIQVAQGSCTRNYAQTSTKKEGDPRYTDFMQHGGGWSVYAGDDTYKDADAVRVGIHGLDDYDDGFCLKDTDIRFGIQLTSSCTGSWGNSWKEGEVQYTPWASELGGWSDFAGDSDNKDFTAARILIETRTYIGLEINNVQIGAQLSDSGCRNTLKNGNPVYSDWLTASGNGGWSNWGSDNNWNSPDSVAVYMGVYTNNGITFDANAAFTATWEDEESVGMSGGAVAAIVVVSLLCCLLAIGGFVYFRRKKKVLMAGVPDDEEVIGTIGDTNTSGEAEKTGYDMTPIGQDVEQEVMIEVEVTETAH